MAGGLLAGKLKRYKSHVPGRVCYFLHMSARACVCVCLNKKYNTPSIYLSTPLPIQQLLLQVGCAAGNFACMQQQQ